MFLRFLSEQFICYNNIICLTANYRYLFLIILMEWGWLTFSISIPTPSSLAIIHNLSQARNVELITRFTSLEDTESYEELPQCLQDEQRITLNSVVDWNNPHSYKIINNKELYVATLHDAYVDPSKLGTFFDEQQLFLFDLYLRPGSPIFWFPSTTIKEYKVKSYEQLATVQGPTFYYHWVIDRLPSILLMKDQIINNPDLKLLINTDTGNVPNYVQEYLDLLGIPRNQRIVTPKKTLFFAKTLYFSTPFLMEPIPRNLLLILRSQLLDSANCKLATTKNYDNLIIVIQRKEKNRKIANIRELESLIKSLFYDYNLVIFDGSQTIRETIRLFNHAKVIVGVMASGLANILFAKPGTTVIEIHPEFNYLELNNKRQNDGGYEWCWWLASCIGLDYWFVTAPFGVKTTFVECPLQQIKKILTITANNNYHKGVLS
jgi:hypothetical protein